MMEVVVIIEMDLNTTLKKLDLSTETTEIREVASVQSTR